MNTPTKEQIVSLLRAWIKQRPGLDYREYGNSRECYMGDLNPIMQEKRDAERLLESVENSAMTAEELLNGFSAYSGRLQIVPDKKDGEFCLEYCTGQYWPTEYRAATCAVLASALWNYHRDENSTGDSLRKKFKRMYGIGIQKRWFN